MNQKPNNPNEPKTIRTSVAAATSMTFGIMSPVVLCSCLPTIVTSLCAIVLGHIALVKIKKSNGALVGRGRAITGLAIGYPFLILSLCLAPTFFSRIENFKTAMGDLRESARNQGDLEGGFSSGDGMYEAERKIVFTNDIINNGNSSDAVNMARAVNTSLTEMRDLMIVSEDGAEGHVKDFIVFCQNQRDSVCFLIYVPEYRHYEDDAKEVLASAAWTAAAKTVQEMGYGEDVELAVGLKGTLLYGSVMIGHAKQDSPNSKSTQRDRLKRFFSN